MSPTAYQDLPSYTRAYHFKPSRFLPPSFTLLTFDTCDVMARLLLFVMVLALPKYSKFYSPCCSWFNSLLPWDGPGIPPSIPLPKMPRNSHKNCQQIRILMLIKYNSIYLNKMVDRLVEPPCHHPNWEIH